MICQIMIMLTNPPRSLSEDPLNIIFQIVRLNLLLWKEKVDEI